MTSDRAAEHSNGNGHALPALLPEREVGEARYPHAPSVEEFHLRDYYEVLLRHRWTIGAFFAVVVVATLVVTLVAVPTYRATTLVEIRAQDMKVVAFQDVVQMSQIEREFYQTQYDVLRSRSLARRVLDRLDLAANPTFNPPAKRPGLVARATGWIGRLFTRPAPPHPQSEALVADQELVERLLGAVGVTPRRNSYLVEVSFVSRDAQLAADVANALAQEYVAMALDQRIEAAQQGGAFIEKQLALTKEALEKSEAELQAFATRNAILTIDSKQNIEYQKLGSISDALSRAQHDRMAKESLFAQVSAGGDGARLTQLLSNAVVTQLSADLAKREAERARLVETFTAEYPKVKRLEAMIDAIKAQIKSELALLTASMRADFEAARRQEQLLASALDAQKAVVNDLNQRSIDYKIIKREVDTNRSVYKSLLQRLKEVEVTEGIKASNIHVVDVAELPQRPWRPRPILNLGLAMLVGLVGGVGLAFFREHLDNSIKTPDEVERYLRLPTLGALPQLRPKRQPNGTIADASPELVVVDEPKSLSAEAMRTLRASLFLSTAAGPPQRILVTSARPQEGKTCVTANLAIVLAQMGRKVVLIDCDFRRPRVHRVFGFDLEPGATSFLSGNADLPSVIRHTQYGVDVITGGPVPPNPVELIDSTSMVSLVEELSRRYDFVLFDAPPSIGFADVPLLARLAGGVLFVVRSGETPRKAAASATDHLHRLRAKILGVVLNGVRTGGAGYYYASYYGYYSYYMYDQYADDAAPATNGRRRVLDGPSAPI